jgi:predicted DsbA family dithiol-disulfide isomerase
MAAATTADSSQNHLSIEITSDTVCPFCYIGYKRIRKAIDQCQDLPVKFSIRFSPFQLDPTTPAFPGVDKRERYYERFGKDNFTNMEKAMIERGKAEGINFSYGGRLSNTTDSHRVLEKAYELAGQDGQLKAVELLFKRYFEEEKDLGDPELLAGVLAEADLLPWDQALAFVKSNELRDEVQKGFVRAQESGISGVPYTVLDGKYAVSGAQEVSTFSNVLKTLAVKTTKPAVF